MEQSKGVRENGKPARRYAEIERLKAELPFKPEAGESHAAFEAFLCYFDIGANRSCLEVARRVGVSGSAVKRWSGKYRWKERMAAYHEQMLRARVEVEMAAKREVATLWVERTAQLKEQEWQAAEDLLRLARRHIEGMLKAEPGELSLGEVAKALEVASKIGRLATGLATEKTESNAAVQVSLGVDWEVALRKVYGVQNEKCLVESDGLLEAEILKENGERRTEDGAEGGDGR